ncbi:MAG TPA: hypothetical protein VFQ13_07675 [Anaerolineales bacterium]|nr:hypothetical protein [Anaerolineales bacterium]
MDLLLAISKKYFSSQQKHKKTLASQVFEKILLQKAFMSTNTLRKKIFVLCDHDALYSAIEMKLSSLHQISIVRSTLTLPELTNAMPLFDDVDLIILATVSSRADLVPALIDLLPSSQIGKPLVLIISEHLPVPESDDRITFLDFPFDMDGLPLTVSKILGRFSSTGS